MDISSPPSFPSRLAWMGKPLAGMASLRLAAVLLGLYAGIAACGTLIERQHGAEAARRIVYESSWFAALNGLLAVNVAAALLIRFPRRRRFGFAAVHLGVLVLLIGFLAGRYWGVEAQMPIIEGHAAGRAFLAGDSATPDAPPKEIELGFQVYLHKFRRKLDPGADMASHYSSLVDILDRSDPPRKLHSNLLIALNAPIDVADPQSGRVYRLFQSSYRGPWTPGDPEFDEWIDKDRSRDHLYQTQLSVNYDPGRGLKYAGSLLIALGVVASYFPTWNKQTAASVICLILGASAPGQPAAADEVLDWSEWERLPVFVAGRAAPLDTYARETVEAICGRPRPVLSGPDESPKMFSASELLFRWLVEPERWEDVAFLAAPENPQLRESFGLPPCDVNGRRLQYASPRDVQHSDSLRLRLQEMEERAEAEGRSFRPTAAERKLQSLLLAYQKYRLLAFNPQTTRELPQRFIKRWRLARSAWGRLALDSHAARRLTQDEAIRREIVQAGEALQQIIRCMHQDDYALKAIEPAAVEFRRAGRRLAEQLADDDPPTAALAAALHRQGDEMHLALFDEGGTPCLVPALNPGALEENRSPGDDSMPWLGFHALLDGSDDLLREYPQAELRAARTAWDDVRAAYLERDKADRPAAFAEAMHRFAEAIRALAQRTEPIRRAMPILHRDEALLDATAYPPPGATDLEVFYNRFDPFFWSWTASLAATLVLLAAVGSWQKPMFWLGMALLVVALTPAAAGLALRAYVTGLVPLTGMFEPVAFSAACVVVLSLGYVLMPLSAPRALERRLFALAGALVSCTAMMLAYYAPSSVMHRNIGAVTPILRDNFWLAVHVVTIMASYASAAIALILGNIALGYYLFGRYDARPRRARSLLIRSILSTIRFTVVLLTAGTILGALWADRSWGRFWGWDPKEAWALISLLVYLTALHARRSGWAGDFGVALAAVFGFTSILVTWYGVNFLWGTGLHAYGSGAGGQWGVLGAIALDWLFLAAAGLRYIRTPMANGGR